MKSNYIITPIIVFLVSFIGGRFTGSGMDWYKTISVPSWTPPGAVIGAVWTGIFILAMISILLFWNNSPRDRKFREITAAFAINAVLNILWSFIFFNQHLIGLAVIEAALLWVSVLSLIILLWKNFKISAILLFPYLAWMLFATFLTYVIYTLN